MMARFQTLLRYTIASVWIFMGLFSKVLDMVPRHRMIVGRVLGDDVAYAVTALIGALEILIAIWVASGIKPRWCALAQTAALVFMNAFELTLAPDLLLLGRAHVVATLFCLAAIWYAAIAGDTRERTNAG